MAGRLHEDEELTEAHEINVTPFIDVMLVLLIIFMVAAPLATVDVPVALPSAATTPMARPDRPVFLTITAEGGLRLGETPVTLPALPAELDQATGGDHGQRLFLRADRHIPYGTLMETMEALRRAGYLKVALVAAEEGR